MNAAWEPDPKIVGQRIRMIRKQKHMTQDDLAEELGGGCTNKTISRYETGMVEMGIQTLCDIAEALEVPVDSLMPDRLRVHNEAEQDTRSELISLVQKLGLLFHRFRAIYVLPKIKKGAQNHEKVRFERR